MLRPLDNAVLFATRMLGVQLHDGQARFLLDDHPLRVLVGGRRAGKTQVLAILIAWLAVVNAIQGKPFKALITSPTLDQSRVLLAYVLKLLRSSPLLETLIRREVESPFPQVEVGETVVLMARSLAEHGRHVRGHGRDLGLIALDEAFLVDEGTIKEVLSPLLADTGGAMVISSTATAGEGSYLHKLFERGRDGSDARVKSFHFRSLDNPFLDQSYVLAQKNEISEEQWETEWEGKFGSARNALFKWDDISGCSEGDLPPNADGRKFTIGFDPAKLRDRSAVIVLDNSSLPRRVAHLQDLHGRDFTMQVKEVAELSRRYFNAKVVIDATGAGLVLVDLLRASGVHSVEPVVFTAMRKVELITGLVVALEKRELSFPADRRLIDELRFFEARKMPNGSVKYEASSQSHDDFISALALALWGSGGAVRGQSFAAMNLPAFLGSNDHFLLDANDAPVILGYEDGFPTGSWGPF